MNRTESKGRNGVWGISDRIEDDFKSINKKLDELMLLLLKNNSKASSDI